MRDKIRLVSSAGTGHFYTTDKNKRNMPDKMQIKKFDPELKYVKNWIPGFRPGYIDPVVEHAFARKRALEVYKQSLEGF